MKLRIRSTRLRNLSPAVVLAICLLVITPVLAAAGDIERVSVSSAGTEANNPSYHLSLSSDGRYAAFESDASNLVAGDTNGQSDIFVRDRTTGTTVRVSVDSSGTQANNSSRNPVISGNGRYVAFESGATNLVAGDTNGWEDIFVHDLQTGTTQRVSVDSSGNQSNFGSSSPSISADGNLIAFNSQATNLVASDTNVTEDVFVHNLSTGDTEIVSLDSSGNQGDATSNRPFIASTGRYVVFESDATNLVASDTNGVRDVFLRDRNTDTTVRVSVDSSGNEANGSSNFGKITSDGRYVAYSSSATNLVAGDSNASEDVFVLDRNTGDVERVSLTNTGDEGDNGSFEPVISDDARYVVFWAYASNLVSPAASNPQVYVRDRTAGTTEMVSKNSSGEEADSSSGGPWITPDGSFIGFQSGGSNLVAGDSNGDFDVFVLQQLTDEQSGSNSQGSTVNKDIANSGTTTLQSGRIWVSVPSNAIPSGESNCRIAITQKGDSGDYGFSLDDQVWDVSIVCDSGKVSILYAPISICIRPQDGLTTDKQVFHKHGGGSFTALASTGEKSGYVCGQTQTLSLFTLGSVAVPNTGFAPGVVTVLPEQPAEAAYIASDLTLSIPELGLDMDIVGVPQGPNGWDVSWLGNDAGYLYGTAFPTMAGNTVLTAHVWNADNTPGPFAELDQLQYGDRFMISAWGSTYTYEVRSSSLYSPASLRPLRHEDYDWVTLITCHDFNEVTGSYNLRRVVRAVLVSVD